MPSTLPPTAHHTATSSYPGSTTYGCMTWKGALAAARTQGPRPRHLLNRNDVLYRGNGDAMPRTSLKIEHLSCADSVDCQCRTRGKPLGIVSPSSCRRPAPSDARAGSRQRGAKLAFCPAQHPHGGFQPRAQIQFAQQVLDVHLHGAIADVQSARN